MRTNYWIMFLFICLLIGVGFTAIQCSTQSLVSEPICMNDFCSMPVTKVYPTCMIPVLEEYISDWCITIHHTVTGSDEPAQRVANIDTYHRSLGWDEIGYHFLISVDGGIWVGRPLDKDGAHVKNHNYHNIGIAFIGNFEESPPPAEAIKSCKTLIALLSKSYHITNERIYFHKELAATKCPGNWDKLLLLKESY